MARESPSKSKTDPQETKTTSRNAFNGLGNLIRLLPTGTIFLFQFLNPVLTNNGKCHTVNKYLSGLLIGACGLSCSLACFTDSYKGSDGETHYGFATTKGLFPSSDDSVDLSKYKLRFGDFVHAFFSVIVFAVLVLLDTNTMRCFYPSFESTEKTLLMIMPTVIGTTSGALFMLFPTTRHGIGYPSSNTSTTPETKTASESKA